jgi:hypothetical protein
MTVPSCRSFISLNSVNRDQVVVKVKFSNFLAFGIPVISNGGARSIFLRLSCSALAPICFLERLRRSVVSSDDMFYFYISGIRLELECNGILALCGTHVLL